MKLKTIDLCAGIGGIRRGFELAGGYRNIASAEIDEMACKTYEHLFHEDPRNDVTNEKFKKHLQTLHYDVLMAGFPCQAFSSVGLQHGFEDKTKGTIFFDIAKIIKMTRPKVVFLENVQNLLSHDKQATFKTIVDTLDRQLDYHIVGVTHDKDGIPQYKRSAFLRNSRDFGVPQNRPRVYIVAFSRAYFGQHISLLPEEAPTKRSRTPVFKSLADVLDKKVDSRFFLSSGYLDTLEKHIVTQHKKGYGFGYCIVNAPEIETPIANTLLATGGSGRERNLIYDPINGASCAGTSIKGKYSPINDKFIRTMTPNEWGRLQGFVGYAFVDKNGIDQFSFPEDIRNVQRFKQFGNSVTIPVIEEYALFIQQCCDTMYDAFSPIEKRLFSMYGNEFLLCSLISRELAYHLRKDTLNRYFSIVYHYKLNCFRTKELARYVLDEADNSVKEVVASDLSEGDVIVFTRSTSKTRDIVEEILRDMINNKLVPPEIEKAYYKSREWKKTLIDYMKQTGSSAKAIADEMISNGVSVQEITIRGWLDEESHTVRPQKLDSIQQIALIAGNDELFDSAEVCFDAGGQIYKIRRRILKAIGQAILGEVTGNSNATDSMTATVADRIKDAAVTLQIETITFVDDEVPVNTINRPITIDQ